MWILVDVQRKIWLRIQSGRFCGKRSVETNQFSSMSKCIDIVYQSKEKWWNCTAHSTRKIHPTNKHRALLSDLCIRWPSTRITCIITNDAYVIHFPSIIFAKRFRLQHTQNKLPLHNCLLCLLFNYIAHSKEHRTTFNLRVTWPQGKVECIQRRMYYIQFG